MHSARIIGPPRNQGAEKRYTEPAIKETTKIIFESCNFIDNPIRLETIMAAVKPRIAPNRNVRDAPIPDKAGISIRYRITRARFVLIPIRRTCLYSPFEYTKELTPPEIAMKGTETTNRRKILEADAYSEPIMDSRGVG
jgi:hypothetical protein